jgi:hypothetical protein
MEPCHVPAESNRKSYVLFLSNDFIYFKVFTIQVFLLKFYILAFVIYPMCSDLMFLDFITFIILGDGRKLWCCLLRHRTRSFRSFMSLGPKYSSEQWTSAVHLLSFWYEGHIIQYKIKKHFRKVDRLCGVVVTVPGYRSWGPGFDCRRYQIFWEVVGLERGPLSLVRIIERLRSRKPWLTAVGIRWADHATPSIRKSWH